MKSEKAEELESPPLVAGGRKWRKVKAPKRWNAAEGEVIEGVYAGLQNSNGANGPYQRVLIQTDDGQVKKLTGVVILELVAGACIDPGARVRIVFLGWAQGNSGHEYRDYDLWVEET